MGVVRTDCVERDLPCDYGSGCPLPPLNGSELCVCHARVSEKSHDDQLEGLKTLLRQTGDLSGVYITTPVQLNGFEVDHSVVLSDAHFLESLEMESLVVKGHFIGSGLKIGGRASFQSSSFWGGLSFRDATVAGRLDFRDAEWLCCPDDDVVVKASSLVADDEVVAKGGASFFRGIFHGGILFDGAKFGGNADFRGVQVTDGKTFSFRSVTVGGDLNLTDAKLSGDLVLETSRLRGGTWFYHLELKGVFKSRDVVYGGLVSFTGKSNKLLFSSAGGTLQASLFQKPENVYFEFCDFSRFELRQVNLRGVSFDRVQWYNEYHRRGVYDEVIARGDGNLTASGSARPYDRPNFDQVRSLYAEIKTHWISQGQPELAAEFHYGEREMARIGAQRFEERILNCIYLALCGYGERPIRALGVLVCIWVSFTLFYWLAGQELSEAPLYSLQVMTLQNRSGSGWLETLHRVLGPIQMGLFALTVRRRFIR